MPCKLYVRVDDRPDKDSEPGLPQAWDIMDLMPDASTFGTWAMETNLIACVRITDLDYPVALQYLQSIEAEEGPEGPDMRRTGRTLKRVARYGLNLAGLFGVGFDVRNRVFEVRAKDIRKHIIERPELLNPDYVAG